MLADATAAPSDISGLEWAGSERAIQADSPLPYEFRLVIRDDPEDQRPNRGDAMSEPMFREALDKARLSGFDEGQREGRCIAHAELEDTINAAIAEERAHIASALTAFQASRGRYFAAVEQEVVRLSLAIAARILHREAQLDPLLLSSVVRVALDKLADSSAVTLRIPADQLTAWQEIVQSIDTKDRPIVTTDASLACGDCVLETRMGTVELGIASQLEEIERGFFDLLNHKPAS